MSSCLHCCMGPSASVLYVTQTSHPLAVNKFSNMGRSVLQGLSSKPSGSSCCLGSYNFSSAVPNDTLDQGCHDVNTIIWPLHNQQQGFRSLVKHLSRFRLFGTLWVFTYAHSLVSSLVVRLKCLMRWVFWCCMPSPNFMSYQSALFFVAQGHLILVIWPWKVVRCASHGRQVRVLQCPLAWQLQGLAIWNITLPKPHSDAFDLDPRRDAPVEFDHLVGLHLLTLKMLLDLPESTIISSV